jgi:hypothetical protein
MGLGKEGRKRTRVVRRRKVRGVDPGYPSSIQNVAGELYQAESSFNALHASIVVGVVLCVFTVVTLVMR